MKKDMKITIRMFPALRGLCEIFQPLLWGYRISPRSYKITGSTIYRVSSPEALLTDSYIS
ncbi:uncharacterized protein METZ01_LOCUS304390 [marine metagenome]|uniref:Uncharacterized protein n=1 Tax=marine metagenome TaxID=408172 RepID=A0A382MS42_9ZZZZ